MKKVCTDLKEYTIKKNYDSNDFIILTPDDLKVIEIGTIELLISGTMTEYIDDIFVYKEYFIRVDEDYYGKAWFSLRTDGRLEEDIIYFPVITMSQNDFTYINRNKKLNELGI